MLLGAGAARRTTHKSTVCKEPDSRQWLNQVSRFSPARTPAFHLCLSQEHSGASKMPHTPPTHRHRGANVEGMLNGHKGFVHQP